MFPLIGFDLPYCLLAFFIVDIFYESLIERAKLEQVPSYGHALAALPFHELRWRDTKQECRFSLGEAEQLPAFPETVTCKLRDHAMSILKGTEDSNEREISKD